MGPYQRTPKEVTIAIYVEISHEKSKVFSTFANQFPQPDFTPPFQSGDSWMYPDPNYHPYGKSPKILPYLSGYVWVIIIPKNP